MEQTPHTELPPMAWVMIARPPVAQIHYGELVRDVGEGVFEGTWVGGSGASGVLASTTTFGSGVLLDDRGALHVVPPSHMLESIYLVRDGEKLVASNSFVGLLSAARLRLDPTVDYPALFSEACDGVFRFAVPTLSIPVDVLMFDGLRIEPDGTVRDVAKPREEPFLSFDDYRGRLEAALASLIANAPDFEPVATISSGYDSATVATLARELGCRRAVTIAQGKPVRGSDRIDDSGEFVGRALGMEVKAFERLAYKSRARTSSRRISSPPA